MAIELDMATAWQLNHSIQKITIAKFLAQILKKIDKVQKTKKGSPENPKNIEQKKEIAASPPIYILKFLSIKRAIWVKLFTQSKICEIKNSILGTGSMILGVFAEILQLLKRAAT